MMEDICEKYLDFLSIGEGLVQGVIKSEEMFNNFINDLKNIGYSYSVRTSKVSHTIPSSENELPVPEAINKGGSSTERLIRFDQLSGLPYIYGKRVHLQCSHGVKYYKSNASTNKQDRPTGKKTRFLIQNTKKIGCKSEINVKLCHMFVDEEYFDAAKKTRWKQRKISEELHQRYDSEHNKPSLETWHLISFVVNHSHPATVQHLEIDPEMNLLQPSILKQYNPELPEFLHRKPHKYIKHIMPRYLSALSEFSESDLSVMTDDDAIVEVKSSITPLSCNYVDFCKVTCTCPDYKKLKKICKHFCACFIHLPTHGFDRLPQNYRDDPKHCLPEVDLKPPVNSYCFENNKTGAPSVEIITTSVEESELKSNCERNTPSSTSKLKENLREILMKTIGMTYNLPEDPDNDAVLKKLLNQARKLKSNIQQQQNTATELKSNVQNQQNKATELKSNVQKKNIIIKNNSTEQFTPFLPPVKKRMKMELNTPWDMGRVFALHPEMGDLVRVTSVKTHSGVVRRSIHKLFPLLNEH